jgi:hypothetical protein
MIKILSDGCAWRVTATEGSGESARRRSWHPPTEEDALQLADELMSDSDGWREITTTRRPRESEDM